MRRDAIGASRDRGERRAYRIGIAARPRIAKGGDVIDIDTKTQWRSGHAGLTAFELWISLMRQRKSAASP
jgi:hypothetical protein